MADLEEADPPSTPWSALAYELTTALHLSVPPVAITFLDSDVSPELAPGFDAPMSAPTADGRSGRVPAGCVFWIHAATRTFSTEPEDHGNCSVGSFTHGFASLGEVAGTSDVAALVESGWVGPGSFAGIPRVKTKARSVVYGPLDETPVDPDVVLLRVNGRQMMVVTDAVPSLRIEGKPQCHIVAMAKEHDEVTASVGCALSRARTGMRPEEMTCAIPGRRLREVVDAIREAAVTDTVVAKYAAQDALRFVPAG